METRQVTQIKLYTLLLNNMTYPKIEFRKIVAFSTEYDKLVEWYNNQKADTPYREDGYYKVFKKGSPLEYFNPVDSLEPGNLNHFGQGIQEEWILEDRFENAKRNYLFIE